MYNTCTCTYVCVCESTINLPPSGPPTVEAVMDLLWSVAGLWKVIAEGLGFDDDIIDEIFTNNEMEEACLQDCVEQWMRLGPTWQKLAHVLSDMGQNSLAQQAWSGGGVMTLIT